MWYKMIRLPQSHAFWFAIGWLSATIGTVIGIQLWSDC